MQTILEKTSPEVTTWKLAVQVELCHFPFEGWLVVDVEMETRTSILKKMIKDKLLEIYPQEKESTMEQKGEGGNDGDGNLSYGSLVLNAENWVLKGERRILDIPWPGSLNWIISSCPHWDPRKKQKPEVLRPKSIKAKQEWQEWQERRDRKKEERRRSRPNWDAWNPPGQSSAWNPPGQSSQG